MHDSEVNTVIKSRRSTALVVLGALLAALVPSLGLSGSTAPVAAEGNEAPAATANEAASRAIAAGGTHTCAIVAGGRVRCWGNNTSGRLGLGDALPRGDAAGEMGDDLPTVVLGFGRPAVEVAAGAGHTCALLDNGQVKCWGANGNGRLGQGDTLARGDDEDEMGGLLLAVNLGAGRVARAVATGNNHTCALLDNGQVKCWGNNGQGQLGLGDVAARGDAANEMGDNLPAVQLGTGRTAVAVTAGNAFTCALLDNGAVKCWGDAAQGRLGLGNTTDRGVNANQMGDNLPAVDLGTGRTALAITAGDTHACALLDTGQLKCWGNNGSGRLGLGDVAARGDNAGEMGDNLPAVSLGTGRTVTAVTAGDLHTCALLDNATAKCWGENDFGRLGLGNTADRGDAAGEMGNALPAISLGTGRTVTAVTAGGLHTCATLDTGLRKCWGRNSSGQLGLGDVADRGDAAGEMGNSLPTVDLGPGRIAARLAAGNGHNCVIADNGQLKCWGASPGGQLGLGDSVDRGDGAGEMGDALAYVALGAGRTVLAVDVGASHACAVLDNHSLRCWGSNSSGELGLGDTAARGDGPGEMGDALPRVELGTGRTVVSVETGGSHTCALLDDGTVKCWGDNAFGQLGLGDTADRGDQAAEMGNALPAVDLGSGRSAQKVAAGYGYTCALLTNLRVKCWGGGDHGRLGMGDTTNRGDGPGEMGDALFQLDLAIGAGVLATDLDVGDNHACARLTDGSLRCWGYNFHGQLGVGDTETRGDNLADMGTAIQAADVGTGRRAIAFEVGYLHTCAVLDTGRVKCWGYNANGRLGLGDDIPRGDNPGEMGNALPPVDLGGPRPTGVSGTVTTAGSGARIPGAMVAVLDTTNFALAGGTVADPAGNYAVEVPPGTYFVYVLDPTGRHTPGFAGAPTAVTVTTAGLIDSDVALAATTGSVRGKVDEAGTGDLIPGAWAFTLAGATGAPEVAVPVDAGGRYLVDGLTPGPHFVGWIDPAGDHPVRFAPSSPDVPGATPVTVTAGAETESIGSLPAQPGTPTGAELQGTVTETGSGAPIPDVLVVALHAADYRLARVTPTGIDGSYSLDLQAGGYKLAFIPAQPRHGAEWHDNQPVSGLASAVNVTAPSTTNAALSPTTGSIAGTVTAIDTGRGLGGAWAIAIAANGTIAGGTPTRPDGGYTISGLPPGTYRVTFGDPGGGRTQEYYDDSATYFGATPLAVAAGATTSADATLG